MKYLAYWTDQHTKDIREIKQDPVFDKIRHLGDWSYVAHSVMIDGGRKKGVLAYWKQDKPPTPENLAEPRQSFDSNLLYFAPDYITQRMLAKEHRLPMFDYVTRSGVQLSIPLAVGGAQIVDFTNLQFGGYADEFPRLAMEIEQQFLDEEKENPTINDPKILRLIIKALEQCYKVTPDLLSDLQWIDSHDVEPIFNIIMGIHEKYPSADEIMSDSSARDSSKNPSAQSQSGAA